MGLVSGSGSVGLGAQTRRREAWGLEVLSEEWGDEAAEEDLSTAGLGKTRPEENKELSSEVEWNPVSDAKKGLENGEEGENHPVGHPLGLIDLGRREEGIQAVVARNEESGQVGQSLASEVEGNEEEVKSTVVHLSQYSSLSVEGTLEKIVTYARPPTT